MKNPQLGEVILLMQKNVKVKDETVRANLCAPLVS